MASFLVVVTKLIFIEPSTSVISYGDWRWQNASTFSNIENFVYRLCQCSKVFVHRVIVIFTLILPITLISCIVLPRIIILTPISLCGPLSAVLFVCITLLGCYIFLLENIFVGLSCKLLHGSEFELRHKKIKSTVNQ